MSAIGEGLASWTRIVLRFRWATLALALVLAVLAVRYVVADLGVNTDTANMMSPELDWRQHFNEYRESFPGRDRNLIVLVESDSPRDAERIAEGLAERLRAEPETFNEVFLAGYGEFFERNGLLYLTIDDLESLSDRLADAQPLLGLIRQNASAEGIVDVTRRTLIDADAVAGPAALDRLHEAVAAALEGFAAGGSAPIDWQSLIRDDAGEAADRHVIVVQPALDFTRLRPARPAIERLREIGTELAGALGRPVSLRLTGTLALEDEELDSVVSSAGLAGILALLMVSVVLVWSLRSARLIFVALLTLILGLIGTASFAAVAVGHLNLLSVAFAVLYVGLGVDFILHITLRVKELLAANLSMDEAIDRAMRGVGASLVVCTITTAAAFYSFIPTPFEGVSELGLISGTGMFISFAASVTLLPALLSCLCTRDSVGRIVACPLIVTRLAELRPRVIVLGAAALVVASVISLPRVYFDSNPVNLRDPDSESVRALEALAASSDADLLTLVALADGTEQAEIWASELEGLPEVERVIVAGSLVPLEQRTKLEIIDDIDLILGPGFDDLEARRSEPRALAEGLESLSRALVATTDSPTRARLRAAAEAAVARLSSTGAASTDRLDRDLLANLPESLETLRRALEARPFGRGDLPEEITSRWIDPAGHELIEIVPTEDITDNDAATRLVTAVRSIVPHATGLPVVYHEAGQTVVASFELALTYALVLVTLLLLLFLRSVRDSLLVLLPISGAALVTAGMTTWFGIPFNFANIIALPLLVGVGVDNAIHIVHRTRTEPTHSGNVLYTSTSLAVLASGLTTIASFGNLAFSTHRGMASMGTLLTIGMIMTMLATLVFLPALLGLGSRR